MIYVHHSNYAEIHKALIARQMLEEPLCNPLAEEVVLVQSPGMAQWLKIGLAEELGISANIRFPLPSSFIWDLFVRVLPDLPKESAFNKEAMGWKLMHLLPQFLDQPEFSSLNAYLQDDQGQRKRYQLAMKVADIFDQYLVYRPNWILAWERNETADAPVEQQPWQPVLWRALVAYNQQLGGHPAHRANLYQQFCQRLAKGIDGLNLPQRVFVFGVSALAPQYLSALAELGRHLELHILQLNPCRYYWGDIVDERKTRWIQRQDLGKQGRTPLEYQGESNPLLASMGKLGRDYQEQLHGLEQQLQLAVNHRDHFVDFEANSLLDMIQSDLLNLENRGQLPQGEPEPDDSRHKTELNAQDSSVEVHLCHSPMREVEVLFDRLLTLFDNDKALKPRDVLVMVPAVDQYSAYIQAVFGNALAEQQIPWSIADRGVQQENPLLISFFRLLQLPTSRFEVTGLLDVLEVPEVLKRFELHPDEFNQLRDWIRSSGIRWGLDDQQLASAGLYPQQQNSWLFGLQRMLLGLAQRQQEGVFGGILPFDEVEGLAAQKLGKLIDFVESLRRYYALFSEPASANEWMHRCNGLLEAFYDADMEAQQSFGLIRQSLDRLQQQLRDAHYEEAITPEVFVEYLQANVTDASSSQRFLAGQVNFCTLMPMRSIPFKVVCLLGMNDGAYPRSLPPLGFDLMASKPLLGDRSRRDDDRYLFLEALLSARDKLYISYVARSIRDNSPRIPSVLVSELLEYCQQGFAAPGDLDCSCEESARRLLAKVSTEHSLQPFSTTNFTQKNDTLNSPGKVGVSSSYDRHWLAVAQALSNRQYSPRRIQQTVFCDRPLAPVEVTDDRSVQADLIELPQLLRFFDNAPRYFLNQRLRVFFDELTELEEDDEPFEQDFLERHQQCTELVRLQLQGGDVQAWEQQLKLSGNLPVGHFGDLVLEEWQRKAATLVANVGALTESEGRFVDVDIRFDWLCETDQSGELTDGLSGDLKVAVDNASDITPNSPPQGTVRSQSLQGRIGNLYADRGLVLWRIGDIKARDCLRLWIQHLVLNASGQALSSQMIAEKKRISFSPFENSESAKARLQALVQLFSQGQGQPLPLPVESARAWAVSMNKNEDADSAWMAAGKQWQSSMFIRGEDTDPYLSRIYPSLDALKQTDFGPLASRVFDPLLAQMSEEKLS